MTAQVQSYVKYKKASAHFDLKFSVVTFIQTQDILVSQGFAYLAASFPRSHQHHFIVH